MTELKTITLSDVKRRSISYLWQPYIALGSLTLIFGNGGTGKSWLTLAVAAAVTKGQALPSSDKALLPPSNVIIQNTENDIGAVIGPRLDILGADCSKIHSIDVSETPLSLTDSRIEEAIRHFNAKIFFCDPVQAHLSKSISMNRAESIRPAFMHLTGVAERTGCAIVLVGHFSKSRVASEYRGLGSVDIVNAVPNVLYVGYTDKEAGKRAVVHGKANFSEHGESQEFLLSKRDGFQWLGECDATVEDVTAIRTGGRRRDKQDFAEEFLYNYLEDGTMPSRKLFDLAKANGISNATFRRAKKAVGAEPKKDGKSWSTGLN